MFGARLLFCLILFYVITGLLVVSWVVWVICYWLCVWWVGLLKCFPFITFVWGDLFCFVFVVDFYGCFVGLFCCFELFVCCSFVGLFLCCWMGWFGCGCVLNWIDGFGLVGGVRLGFVLIWDGWLVGEFGGCGFWSFVG